MRLALLTHEPFYPPSGGGSAEAVYLVEEMVRRGHEVHLFCPAFPDHPGVAEQFSIRIHPFTGWQMGRYTNLRSLKYLAYPRALRKIVLKAATEIEFDAIFSQHAISAVAAGKLKSDLNPDILLDRPLFRKRLSLIVDQASPPGLRSPPHIAVAIIQLDNSTISINLFHKASVIDLLI